jgi:hypothetical protein
MTQPVPQQMTPQEYIAAQAAINMAAIQTVSSYVGLFQNMLLSELQWLRILEFLFLAILRFRTQSAELARKFFDSQYNHYLPGEPKHNLFLRDQMDFPWFVQKMQPAKRRFLSSEAVQADSDRVLARLIQIVEEAGRNTIIDAVEDLNQQIIDGERELRSEELEQQLSPRDSVAEDLKRQLAGEAGRPRSEPKETVSRTQVAGWARVATGRETCAFCLILVSRGPVYRAASTTGLKLSDPAALDKFLAGEDVSEWMTQWHPNCDCKVVPVFDSVSWAGASAQDRALRIWKNQTKDTFGKDSLNAFRREVERGNVNVADFAID